MYPYILVSIALALLFAVSCHGAIESAPVSSTPWPSCWWWVKCSTTAWAFGPRPPSG